MAKFYGVVGFVEHQETSPGVHKEITVERPYYGDMNRNSYRFQPAEQLNDHINVNNEFSIVSDPYAMQNYHLMRYVKFRDTAWKITNVIEQYPRLILSVGGVYNG